MKHDLKIIVKAAIAITGIITIATPFMVGPVIFNAAMPAGLQFGGVMLYAVCAGFFGARILKLAKDL